MNDSDPLAPKEDRALPVTVKEGPSSAKASAPLLADTLKGERSHLSVWIVGWLVKVGRHDGLATAYGDQEAWSGILNTASGPPRWIGAMELE